MPNFQDVITDLLFLAGGLVLLIFGADWLVSGASAIARRLNVSDLAIGLTIVSFGTSAPELVVNTFASYNGNDGIVFGNVIGSNNFNLFVILGIAGLIIPLRVAASTVWREIPLSFLAVLVLWFLVNDSLLMGDNNTLSRVDGLILLLFFMLFLWYVYKQLGSEIPMHTTQKQRPVYVLVGLVLAGLAGLVAGGRIVVNSAVSIATDLGMSEKTIGLTIVAAGTSLPELATSVVAAIKKNNDIAVGNVVGSNIFNIFFILAASALIKPVSFDPTLNTDLYLLMSGTALLFVAMFLSGRKKLDRWEAALLLIIFVSYTWWMLGRG